MKSQRKITDLTKSELEYVKDKLFDLGMSMELPSIDTMTIEERTSFVISLLPQEVSKDWLNLYFR
ncbi:hypothetical protein OAD50_01375 [Vicingaceae bacterium]|nr:hypothetical protein [Vicingaceae bacterium]